MTTVFSYDQTKPHSSEHSDSEGTFPALSILAILAGYRQQRRAAPSDVWFSAALVATCGLGQSGLVTLSFGRAEASRA